MTKHSEPGKTVIGALLIFMGMMTFFGGLQLNGWWKLLAVPGPLAVIAVFNDQVFRGPPKKAPRKKA